MKTRRIVLAAFLGLISVALLIATIAPPKESLRRYYIICSVKTSSYAEAAEYASLSKFKGGGGYMFKEGNVNYVALMGYKSAEDAKSVLNRLNNNYFIKEIPIKVTPLTEELLTLFDAVYDKIVLYDTNRLDEEDARSLFSDVAEKCNSMAARYGNYEKTLKELSVASKSNNACAEENISYLMKNLLIKIIFAAYAI